MAAYPHDLDSEWQRGVRRRLLDWYRKNARPLPWRDSADPYRVWTSEIMLQQTTIAAVKPYFERFHQRFPSVETLAAAEEAEVLREWEGLGYYSRARNLHKAAQQIVDEHAGVFPESVEQLQKLPGIGPYTARAVASVAFGQGVGILEANTIRLYSRLVELTEDPRSTPAARLLWNFADWIVAPRSASAFNQAAMDVGSVICKPEDPECDRCPLRSHCCSFRSGRQAEIPRLPAKKKMTDVTEAALVLCRRDRVLMRQYAEGERWAGLWDFVRFPVSVEDGDQLLLLPQQPTGRRQSSKQPTLFPTESTALAVRAAEQQTGLQIASPVLLKQIRHTVTRYRIRLLCIQSNNIRGRIKSAGEFSWQPFRRLDELPLSTTARTIAELLQQQR